MKFSNVRHRIATEKLQKDEDIEEDAEIEIQDAITAIEIDLDSLTRKED